jgi:hypothetical protein
MIGNKEYTVGVYFPDSEYGEMGAYPNMAAIEIGNEFSPVWGTWFTQLSTQASAIRSFSCSRSCYSGTTWLHFKDFKQRFQALVVFAATTEAGDMIAQDMTWSDETAAIFGRMTVHVSDTLRYT